MTPLEDVVSKERLYPRTDVCREGLGLNWESGNGCTMMHEKVWGVG